MTDNTTIIVVGHTEVDSYGNLLVSPQGGGKVIKIAKKREHLHPLFEQGKAVMLDWQTYMEKPYVADAKLVEGDLPTTEEVAKVIDKPLVHPTKPQPQSNSETERLRSMCLAYSKDLCVASKIRTQDITLFAELFYRYVVAKITEDDEAVAQFASQLVRMRKETKAP